MFVKVCGVTTPSAVAAAVEAGADAIGFVLTASPRRLEPRVARALGQLIPAGVLTVGVFRQEPVQTVMRCVHDSGVGAVQLHGDESPERFELLRQLDVQLIRASSGADSTAPRCGAFGEDMLIIDSPSPGSGRQLEWDQMPRPTGGRWMLAGGLRPGNVATAILAARPWGVDVSSGVESHRGIKDPGLIRDFVAAAHATPVRG